MSGRIFGKQLNAFQIIIGGFGAIILLGAGLLMLPFSSPAGRWTSVEDALFTATSAVCVTGLVVRDTATCWSLFGQAVILMLIQIGGLGIATVTALIATVSGRKISLLQRNMLQESISAHQMGGILKLTRFICKVALAAELLGALLMLPAFLSLYGRSGAWMALFHSVSAFCNAGFDIMGNRTGAFRAATKSSFSSKGILSPMILRTIRAAGMDAVRPGDSMPIRLTRPGQFASSLITKSRYPPSSGGAAAASARTAPVPSGQSWGSRQGYQSHHSA